MYAPLAALLCIAFVFYLFDRELRRADAETISWVPFAWMFLAGSRYMSSWLSLGSPAGVDGYSEGSPVDRAVFFALIVWGATVLARRDVDWRRLVSTNKWLVFYFAYCFASIVWSDVPFVLAKRWVKDLGNPIMALVMLTERRPYDALVTTLRRLSFVFVPVSVLFIRYYPELGRGYTLSGTTLYTGIGEQKNSLGLVCLLGGLCYVWAWTQKRGKFDKYHIVLAAMIGWLLYMSNSQTSLTCLIVCVAILMCSRLPFVVRQPTRVLAISVAGAVTYGLADQLFGIRAYALNWLGRDASFTSRTDVWAIVRQFETNALLGSGFMSFWSGERMAAIWDAIQNPINQAHNGYLEQYLNLGYVGVAFIIVMFFVAFFDVRRHLLTARADALLRLCILVTALLYNYTEAAFYGVNNLWVLMLASCVDSSVISPPQPATVLRAFQKSRSEATATLTSRPARLFGRRRVAATVHRQLPLKRRAL